MGWLLRIGLLVTTVLGGVISLAGCGQSTPTSPDNPNGKGGGSPVPLLDLLARLPEDCWPKDGRDTLRSEKARSWYDSNTAGQRASWRVPNPDRNREFKFSLDEKNGKYTMNLRGGGPTVKLFEREWPLSVSSPGGAGLAPLFNLYAKGLSESAAERLRKWVGEPPLEVTFTVSGVTFGQYGDSILTVSTKDDVAIPGFSN